MYVPAAFRVVDAETIASFIRTHSFATLVTVAPDGTPFASHLPMLFEPAHGELGVLRSHMARANPQWTHFAEGRDVLAIFHGPHAYISPSVYLTQPAVPTWNYATVHVSGQPTIVTDATQINRMLDDLICTYEAHRETPWPGDLPTAYRNQLIQGIVAFEITIRRTEAKFKLGQNRPVADLPGLHRSLANSPQPENQSLAALMVAECRGLETALPAESSDL